MPKIKIKTELKSPNEKINLNTIGIIQNNIITFKENGIKVIFKINETKLIRDCDDYKIEFNFRINKNTNGIYLAKSIAFRSILNIKTNELIIKDNEIKLNYDLEIEKESIGNFDYHIKYEVIK